MKVKFELVDHSQQRYTTVGDWLFDSRGDLHIRVSDMDNEDYEFLVGIHEAIEAYLCRKRGITDQMVTEFDKQFEARRRHNDLSEPGDDPHAPYRREHFFATNIERLLAGQLGVDWAAYEKTIEELP